jgi:hypothetical protein
LARKPKRRDRRRWEGSIQVNDFNHWQNKRNESRGANVPARVTLGHMAYADQVHVTLMKSDVPEYLRRTWKGQASFDSSRHFWGLFPENGAGREIRRPSRQLCGGTNCDEVSPSAHRRNDDLAADCR